MAQYIDKSALVAEIERLISIANSQYDLVGNEDIRNRILWSQQASVCSQILFFLDTLETKEVDLEKELKNLIGNVGQCDRKLAKHFFELGLKAKDVNEIIKTAEDHAYFAGSENTREKLIEKACKWWEEELSYPSMTPEEIKWYKSKLEDFRKAMEE